MPDSAQPIPIRRVVTGHDAQGRSVFTQDGASPFVLAMPEVPGLVVTDLWKSHQSPTDNASQAEPCTAKVTLTPPAKGSIFRIVQFPPDKGYMDNWDDQATFAAMGHGTSDKGDSRGNTPGMHRTDSMDYAIVISGEIWAVVDEGETLLKAGDVLVQRGTNHGWSNRTDRPTLVAFVLIDAAPLGTNRKD